MAKKDMLGELVRKIVDLPVEMLGVLCDLAEKLLSFDGQKWFIELKRFLRKEECWDSVVKNELLCLISDGEEIIIDECDGSEGLADASDVFSYIDSDFKNWGADEKGSATTKTPVQVYEMKKDEKFAQLFGSLSSDLDKLCLTSHQIKRFVQGHRNWLRTDGYGTFFLFKSNGRFFVADVFFHSDGSLGVYVHQLGDDVVWRADHRHRFVVPLV